MLSIGIFFWWIFGSTEWCRLGHLALASRVRLHFWRLRRVEASVTLLDAVSNIDGAVGTALGDSDSTRPSQRAQHVGSIRGNRITILSLVGLNIAAHSASPSVDTFNNGLIIVKSTELFSRVGRIFLATFTVLGASNSRVLAST